MRKGMFTDLLSNSKTIAKKYSKAFRKKIKSFSQKLLETFEKTL